MDVVIHHKLSKSKGKAVKPILKKLSHSEKNSLDLDRPWEEQQVPGLGVMGVSYEPARSARSTRDVSFTFGGIGSNGGKPHYQHGRSTSGASHVSVASTASGGASRTSGFVHPFQQAPRTRTPPLSYANSMTSIDNAAAGAIRDYSPTITENEDDDAYPASSLPSQPQHSRTTSVPQAGVRHPSPASHRTSSFSDIKAAPPLRISTVAYSFPTGRAIRRGFGSNSLVSSVSHSDLNLRTSPTADSPASIGLPKQSSFASSGHSVSASVHTMAGSSTSTPLSPLRSSFEGFPRLRSRSEITVGDRTEQIREARRKFEERERAKAEKHDREMLRKRERRDQKEAKEIERLAAAISRKNSGGGSFDIVRPSLSRKSTPPFHGTRTSSDQLHIFESAKPSRRSTDPAGQPLEFKSSKYDNVAIGTTPSFGPTVDSVAFKNSRRNHGAKRKTQGIWNGFILWLRTRLFRMSRS